MEDGVIVLFFGNAFRCDLCFVKWCMMAYNGGGGKRLCTGTDLDVERVSFVNQATLTISYVDLIENGRVLYHHVLSLRRYTPQ